MNEEEILQNIQEQIEVAKGLMFEMLEPKDGILTPRLAEILGNSFSVAAKTIQTHG